MSQFTSIKIKINQKVNLATLFSEYGGECEMKIWIVDKGESWTGELSSAEAEEFITIYKITRETFMEELKRALTKADPEILYSIENNKLSWKKCLDGGIIIKNGEMILQKVSTKDIYDEVVERSLEHNAILHTRISVLEKDKEVLLKEKDTVLSSLDKVVNDKTRFEREIFSQFLSILNAKKERIAELRESLDAIAASQGTSEAVNRKVKREAPKRSMIESDSDEEIETKRTQRESNREEQVESKDGEMKEELDPFEVDTDIEEDSPPPCPTKTESIHSQSFNLDSLEEVASPVMNLPKRSRFPMKTMVKKPTE